MGLFSKKKKTFPPYDSLTVEQQRALYFLLEYFSKFATLQYSDIELPNPDALNYLEKALWYFGLTQKDVDLLRPYHQKIDYIFEIIKDIKNRIILDYMVNNTYNLVILAQGDNYEPAHKLFFDFWSRFNYTKYDINIITQKYMYRTDI